MIKNKQTRRTIAMFFLLNFLSTLFPYNALYANNNGPNAPEASGFEPVNATDMVNLSSGDMAYVLPLLEVDGFPVTLSYHAGIPMDMDASWVGLGWNINTGSIARGVVSTPDDWNGGKSMKFTYYYYETESYTVNVGVGFKGGAEVGIGLSWGSNKSLSGSVYGSVFGASASIDTDGNYSLGVGTSAFTGGDASFGASLSVSGNVNRSGIAVGLSAGYSKGGMSAGLGVSISGDGIGGGFSIGGGNSGDAGRKSSSGIGGSIGSFSAGDLSIASSGFYIPINIWIFNFGFGYQKQKISYKKGLNRYGFGSLYQKEGLNDVFNTSVNERKDHTYSNSLSYDSAFDDLQRRNYYGDIYDQELAQHEKSFIQDYKNTIEKINFTFAGYDSYGVNATGISGNLSPILGENTVLIGEGFEGNDTDNGQRKMKVFYHNSYDKTSLKTELSTDKSVQEGNLYFAFNGHVTDNMSVNGSIGNFNNKTTGFNLGDFARASGTYKQKPKMGSFVEVFTNKQLDANEFLMLTPTTVYNKGSHLKRTNDLGYEEHGIGGYKVTTPDGKVYHFAQPVYQYEKIEHNYVEIDEGLNVSGLNSSSKRSATPYATHWLLTAITGPDFIDKNGNNYPDKEDYGYWLRLEHGQWSNAYTWRTPYANSDLIGQDNSITDNKHYRDYSTFNEQNIDKADAGHFLQGRKDLYYLDKIVSREQVAYFVKDIRKDGLGTDLDYNFTVNYNNTKLNVTEEALIKRYPWLAEHIRKQYDVLRSKQSLGDAKPTINGEIILGEELARYEKEYLLRLDKIVIEKNTGSNNQIKNNSSNQNLQGVSEDIVNNAYNSSLNLGKGTLFSNNLPAKSQIHKLHQNQNIIDVNDFSNYDYSKALKVIKFQHSYELAKNSLNSQSSEKGRLTLQRVKFFGRGMVNGAQENQLYDYMPPYEFSYKKGIRTSGEEVVFSRNKTPEAIGNRKEFNKKDSWGFVEGQDNEGNSLVDSWSLNKIKTPQGSTIDIAYEEDDYYVEAFSRRYWSDNLKFKFLKQVVNGVDNFSIHVANDTSSTYVDFKEYFSKGDQVYFDLWLNLAHDNPGWDSGLRRAKIDINVERDACVVDDITQNNVMILKVKGNLINNNVICGYNPEKARPEWVLNNYFSKSSGVSNVSQGHVQKNRGECLALRDVPDLNNHTMSYKLLATKSPKGNNGGGVKVAKITVNDEAGAKYETTYDYKVPGTNKSSGITSFYPVYGTTFVPYQNELPGPGVMYEWVTMTARGYDASGRELPTESTRYHFYTLQPNFHIFDPNFTMKDNDGDVLFKATVTDVNIPKEKIVAKDITIEKNLSKIGQLISIEEFNSEGQLMKKTTNNYVDKLGKYEETFTSMKSVYDYWYNDKDGEYSARNLKRRALSKSTKIEKEQVLGKTVTVNSFGESSVEYADPDPYLGSYRTSLKTMADGTKVKETKYPAYEVYGKMGSKTIDPTNKNMLTQEAMNVTSIKAEGYNNWKTTSAGITTWNNDWSYRAADGSEATPTADNEKIWRKHKSYVWKGNVDANGTYGKELKLTDFKWGLSDTQTNSEWQNVSEITRYTHFSLPVETRDINNNYAASKMDANFSKTLAGGNAKYTEMYFSGYEYPDEDSELTFDSCRTVSTAHTGENAVALTSSSSKAFKLSKTVGANEELRQGKYKVSFWTNKNYTGDICDNAPSGQPCTPLPPDYPLLMVNNSEVKPSETIKAGSWYQYNYTVDLTSTSTLDLYIKEGTASSGSSILDDFRFHPIASSMNSYVYDNDTDELRYILDTNNLATEFKYDKSGRLCRTFKEVLDQGEHRGGFKLVKEYRYRYKNAPTSSSECGCCEAEPVPVVNDAPVAVADDFRFSIEASKELELDVIQNDYDVNSFDVLSINKIESNPVNGTLVIRDNKFIYTPNANFFGQDSFTYSIKDNGNPVKTSNTVRVTITLIDAKLRATMRKSVDDSSMSVCVSGTVNITSGSGDYSYKWTLIDDSTGDIKTLQNNGTEATGCLICKGGARQMGGTIKCIITDNITGQTLVLEEGFNGDCNNIK